MSLIPTRRDTTAEPHAQTMLDLATLQRALSFVENYREPHRSIALSTQNLETVRREIHHRLDALARTVPAEVWDTTPAMCLEDLHTFSTAHGWAQRLAHHGWLELDVVDALGDGAHLPWMRFDNCDGCLAEPTITERLLALHIAQVVRA